MFIVGLSYLTYKKEVLDLGGSAAAAIIGIIVFLYGGLNWFILLFTFLALGTFATRYRYDYKSYLGVAEKLGGTRSLTNVVGSGIVPTAMAMIGSLGFVGGAIATSGFVGAIATATADTLASEIGVLSAHRPRLITHLSQKVPPGTEGAVSALGTAASIVGAGVIGLLAWSLILSEIYGSGFFKAVVLVTLVGFLGCVVDSFLGATLERNGYLKKGQVNFFATLAGAMLGIVIIL